jgi:YD repeat-containing protein
MATFCDMASTWDANNKKTSESITGGMSSYAFNCAETTYDDEDLCFSSSLAPPASKLLVDIDANGTADVNFQYDALGRRVARTGTGGSVVYVQMDQQTIAGYPDGGAASTPANRYVYASYIDGPIVLVRKRPGTGGTWNW